MFDDKGNGLFSMVLLDWVEWEGPLVTEAEKSRRKGVLPRLMTPHPKWSQSICNASPSGLGGGR
jgi:hypothetical protein